MGTIVNAGSETLFYESVWRVAATDGAVLALAAIIDVRARAGRAHLPRVASVTCEPNPDVAVLHDRMDVFLDDPAVGAWVIRKGRIRPSSQAMPCRRPDYRIDWQWPVQNAPALVKSGVSDMSVARVTEIISSSSTSFEDAIENGVARACETLKNVEGAWVQDQKAIIRDGKIKEYRVNLKVTFILQD